MNKRTYQPTRREKALIILLVLFLVGFFSVNYLFLPAVDRYNTAVEQEATVRAMYEQVREQVAQAPAMKAQADDKREELTLVKEKIHPFTDIEVIEREFTQFMILNGLTIDSVTFSPSSSAIPALTLRDIPRIRAESGVLPSNALVALVININASGSNLETVLRLTEYVNSVYSYRLLDAHIQTGGDRVTATYAVEVVLIIE